MGGGAVSSTKLLPDSWSRPAIEAVGIPAHAAMTTVETGVFRSDTIRLDLFVGNPVDSSLELAADEDSSGSLLDYFIDSAEAGPGICFGNASSISA